MIFYSLYYTLIIFLLLLDYFNKNNNFFIYFGLFVIFLITATRFDTGYDFYNYHLFYREDIPESIEPLFKLTVYLLKYFTDNSQWMFVFYSFIIIFVTYFTIIKMTKYTKIALLIFLLIPGLYINSFSIIRHSVALSLFFLGTYYILFENKSLKFWIYSILAIGFHYSAILPIIIVYFFKKILFIKYSIFIYIILIILSITFSELNVAEFLITNSFGKFPVYLDYKTEVSMIKQIVLNIFFIFLAFLTLKKSDSMNNYMFLNLIFIGILILNIFSNYQAVTRLSYYFLIFQIILIPNILYSFKDNISKIILLILFVIFYSLQLIGTLQLGINSVEETRTIYKNYFLEDKYD